MKKILQLLCSAIMSLFIAFWAIFAWSWIQAEVGDIITVAKWNELVDYIDLKVSPENIIWSGAVSVTSSGSDIFITGANLIPPYIEPWTVFIPTGLTLPINIIGDYFTPSTTITVPGFDGTINSVTIQSPTNILVNMTAGAPGSFDVVLSNAGALNTQWSPSNGAAYFSVWAGATWTGPAWTYNESFESGLGNWWNSTGLSAWTQNSWTTGSNGTGPNSWAGGAGFYMYTETSWPWNPGVSFGIETSHFSQIQSISFDYHMYGTGGWMWDFEFQTFNDGVWTTQFSLSWTQQTANADPYINHTIDLSLIQVEKIRFFTTSWDYRSDVAIDNVVIVSI